MNKLLVIMPVYNTEKYLEQAIESVLQQEKVNLDLCIINDGSTDNSMDIINEYSDRDNVIILENEINRGTYYSRNRALELLNSEEYEYFTVHDSDDVSLVNRYYEMIKWFCVADVYCVPSIYMRIHEDYITDEGIDTSKGELRTHPSNGIGMYRFKIFENIGYYDNNRFGADSDYFNRAELWCKYNDKEVLKLNKVMYFARTRTRNLGKIYRDREDYIDKIHSELEIMSGSGNFYRAAFE